MVEGKPISTGNVAYVLGMDPKKVSRWYQDALSGFTDAKREGEIGKHDIEYWEYGQYKRVKVPILKPENMGPYMAIDEKTIDGVCYTILSNRETSKIALMASTLKIGLLHECLDQFPKSLKNGVKSITRDLSPVYSFLAHDHFFNAYHVADKFHIIREILEQLQAHRIRHRQKVLALERKKNKTTEERLFLEEECRNGDTLRQLLHRSRGLLFKRKDEWTEDQEERAKELFRLFPDLKETYRYCMRIRAWYNPIRSDNTKRKRIQKHRTLLEIIEQGKESTIPEMKNIALYLERHSKPILNYFKRRESNAKAEALNQNLQRFISVNYGTRNSDFFLYRIAIHFS